MPRKLRVFLCHASDDKPAVRKLYASLKSVPWIDPWLAEENLIPGQDWDLEIYKATRDADAIIICLSKVSVMKEGYVNKEIRRALDIAEEKLEGTIYVIPLRLDNCIPSFEQLKKLQWADYFTPNAHDRLLKSLRLRADALMIGVPETPTSTRELSPADGDLDLYRFIKIKPQKNSKINYPFWIGQYPVTNFQYERFLNAPDFTNPVYWLDFPQFDEECRPIDNTKSKAADWLKKKLKESDSKLLLPRYWTDEKLGNSNQTNPIVGITWYEACAYCEWLYHNWNSIAERKANPSIKPSSIRLPFGKEWVVAAGGDEPKERYPWDEEGKTTKSLKEILRRTNVKESNIEHTTPVNRYPLGRSPLGVMDMAGNVWEWQSNFINADNKWIACHGGSWHSQRHQARVGFSITELPRSEEKFVGFRVAIIS